MFKRIVSYFTIICIAVSLFSVAAFADEAPEVEATVDEPVEFFPSDSVGALLADDSISTYSTDYDSLILQELIYIYNTVSDILGTSNSIYSALYAATGSYVLQMNGTIGTTSSNTPLHTIVRLGFMGLRNVLVNDIGTSLTTAITAITDFNSDFNRNTVASVGQVFLYGTGESGTLTEDWTIQTINRHGFLGLAELLRKNTSAVTTMDSNTQDSLDDVQSTVETMDKNMQTGFGTVNNSIHSLIAGSTTKNTYSGTVTSNENTESTVSATGLGPMLNTWLDAIQNDTGLLAYMFASPDDLENKAQFAEMYDTLTDTSDESGGDVSVGSGDISSVKGFFSKFKKYFDSGVDVDGVFDVLNDEENYSWFTEETAGQLDTTVSALSLDDEESEYEKYNMHYYDDKMNEFLSYIGGE